MKKNSALWLVAILVIMMAGCASNQNQSSQPLESGISTEQPIITNDGDSSKEPVVSSAAEDEPVLELIAEGALANTLEVDLPENRGMDAERLRQLHVALDGTQILSLVMVKDGYLVDEYYRDGYNETSVFTFQSGTKSFTSALFGIAVDEGLIEGVDVSIAEYFPQLAGTDKEAITIRHLLEHTSGIQWFEWGSNASSWDAWIGSENWVDYILAQPVVSTPGSTFNYSTGGTHLLSAIIEQATGESLMEYGSRHLFEPMGMDSVVWSTDPQGITDGGNGISMTVQDAAKFGQLYLNRGVWNGQQLVPAEWVEESTWQQSAGSGSAGVYGYQWWIRNFGTAQYDTYYAMGYAGQYILVVPELELVTAITSTLNQGSYTPWPYFSNYIVDACYVI